VGDIDLAFKIKNFIKYFYYLEFPILRLDLKQIFYFFVISIFMRVYFS
jgi:hypothetical protein